MVEYNINILFVHCYFSVMLLLWSLLWLFGLIWSLCSFVKMFIFALYNRNRERIILFHLKISTYSQVLTVSVYIVFSFLLRWVWIDITFTPCMSSLCSHCSFYIWLPCSSCFYELIIEGVWSLRVFFMLRESLCASVVKNRIIWSASVVVTQSFFFFFCMWFILES